jgi:hypothetical protein
MRDASEVSARRLLTRRRARSGTGRLGIAEILEESPSLRAVMDEPRSRSLATGTTTKG